MIRTPLYTNVSAAELGRRIAADEEPAREPTRDDYITKLLKYVPAEIVIPFPALVAAAAQVDQPGGAGERNLTILWIAFLIGLVATVGYYYRTAYTLPVDDKPRPYYYALILVSFVIWALAINENIRLLFNNMDERMSEFLLVAGALLVPFADEMLTIFWPRLEQVFGR